MLICKRCRNNSQILEKESVGFFSFFVPVLTSQCNHSQCLSLLGQITHEASQSAVELKEIVHFWVPASSRTPLVGFHFKPALFHLSLRLSISLE